MKQSYKRRISVNNMSEAEDRLLAMIVALTSQVAMMRERIDTLECLLVSANVTPQAAVEDFIPSSEDETRRDQLRQHLIKKVMRPILDEVEHDARRKEI